MQLLTLPDLTPHDNSYYKRTAVLYQVVEERKVIAYASSRFNKREQKYHCNEQECLAVVWATRKYRPYLEDRKFLLRTDNKALTWLSSIQDKRAKLTRWALELQALNFDVEHVPGKNSELPDYLSRHSEDSEETNEFDDHRLLPPTGGEPHNRITNTTHLSDEVRTAQTEDELTQAAIQRLQEMREKTPARSWEQRLYTYYATYDGFLYYVKNGGQKLYVPEGTRARVMYEFHDAALAGHPRAEETSRTIREVFHWHQNQKDTEAHVRRCLICAQCKRRNPTPNAPQRPRQPQEPFETIAVDIMGPYPATSKGNRFLLVVTDLFTRWVEAYPMQKNNATAIIKLLEDETFARFG
ncbi:hypothetical protein Zmor_028321 [Zophobas morio]|uniref:RNA-directed DNA polymerase n=1 Tax=Zophobas morio TaxID=2755281 RepID=A0AA38HVC0_9CUCU|nr:hypothetical protein Zmor_028321 [Zophobas morio]